MARSVERDVHVRGTDRDQRAQENLVKSRFDYHTPSCVCQSVCDDNAIILSRASSPMIETRGSDATERRSQQ